MASTDEHVHSKTFAFSMRVRTAKLATCNAILLLGDVKLENTSFIKFADIFLTYQTFVTNLSRAELRCKLQEKLHRVTGP